MGARSFWNENLKCKWQKIRSYRFEVFVLLPNLADLAFVRETLFLKLGIFQIWLDRKIYLFKASCLMYSFSKNDGGKLPEQEALVFHFLIQKCLLLFLWYLRNYCSYVSENSYGGNLACTCSNTIGFIWICFTNWDLWAFSQGDLLQDCSE